MELLEEELIQVCSQVLWEAQLQVLEEGGSLAHPQYLPRLQGPNHGHMGTCRPAYSNLFHRNLDTFALVGVL